MKTFEIIFGNYEEAKEMWTNLANFLWEAFASGSESRNKLMEEWKELGGRDDLIKGVGNSLRAILNIVTALKGGIAEIFPSPDATQLVALTKKVKEFGDIALYLLPALGTLYFALAGIWEFPYGEEIVGTITALDTFLGVLLGISTAQYNRENANG